MLSRRQFYAKWAKRAFKGRIVFAQGISGLAALAYGVVIFFWQPEGVAMSLVAPLVFVSVFLATVAIGMLRAPFGIYLDEASKYEKDQEDKEGETAAVNSSLEAKINELNLEIDSRDRMRKCAKELSVLIIEGRQLVNDRKIDLEVPGGEWRERVCAVLNNYWPTAASDFQTMHARPSPGAWRDMLRVELDKLDGFMVTLRNYN